MQPIAKCILQVSDMRQQVWALHGQYPGGITASPKMPLWVITLLRDQAVRRAGEWIGNQHDSNRALAFQFGDLRLAVAQREQHGLVVFAESGTDPFHRTGCVTEFGHDARHLEGLTVR